MNNSRQYNLQRPSDYLRLGWTQGTFARNRNGIPLLSPCDEACCWCLSGALTVWRHDMRRFKGISQYESYRQYDVLRDMVRARIQEPNNKDRKIGDFNDSSTFEEVMNVLLSAEYNFFFDYGVGTETGRPSSDVNVQSPMPKG